MTTYKLFFKVPPQGGVREVRGWISWGHRPHRDLGRDYLDDACIQPCSKKAKFAIKLARLELGRFGRLITGHNNLNFFQTKIGLWGDPLCRLCRRNDETIMTAQGFLTYRRETLLNNIPTPDMKWSVRALLEFSYIPAVNAALEGSWAHGDPQVSVNNTSAGLSRALGVRGRDRPYGSSG